MLKARRVYAVALWRTQDLIGRGHVGVFSTCSVLITGFPAQRRLSRSRLWLFHI